MSPPTSALNVLMVVIDDLRNEAGLFGGAAHTPHIDLLGRDSAVFLRNHVQQSVCGPTRASTLTGRRPDITKIVSNGRCGGRKCWWREVAGNYTTLPQHFKEAGYRTASFGKVFDERTAGGETCDFPYSWSEPPDQCSIQGTTLIPDTGASHRVSDPTVDKGSFIDVNVTNAAVKWLADRNTSARTSPAPAPFFLAVGFHRPHLPFIVDQASLDANPLEVRPPANTYSPGNAPLIGWTNSSELITQYGWNDSQSVRGWGEFSDGAMNHSFPLPWTLELRRFYRAAVTHTDTQVGRLLNALARHADFSRTIAVLWGDHGWHLSENGLWGKCTLYEAATRAPLLIKAPGITDAGRGRRIDALTEHVDIFPTLAELAGVPAVPRCPVDGGMTLATCSQGASLVPLMRGAAKSVRTASMSLWPYPGVGRTDVPKYGSSQFPGSMGYSIALPDGRRYTEWVNMSYPNGSAPGPWVPLWRELRAREYYLDETNSHNLAQATDPTLLQELSDLLHGIAGWPTAISTCSDAAC